LEERAELEDLTIHLAVGVVEAGLEQGETVLAVVNVLTVVNRVVG
jgi:hypothetical protein